MRFLLRKKDSVAVPVGKEQPIPYLLRMEGNSKTKGR
jgi:hypothetical protein